MSSPPRLGGRSVHHPLYTLCILLYITRVGNFLFCLCDLVFGNPGKRFILMHVNNSCSVGLSPKNKALNSILSCVFNYQISVVVV